MATRPYGSFSHDVKTRGRIKKVMYSKKDDSLYMIDVAFSSLLQWLAL